MVDSLSERFRFFAATQCRGRSAVYETLSFHVAENSALLQLLMTAPDSERRPSLFFAAVNFLLAAEPESPLRSYYPTHGGTRDVDAGLASAFGDFCATRHTELRDLLAHGSTQTNDIRRCIALRLGMSAVLACWPGPVHLVEIGASAGLNLIFDRYGYDVGGVRTPAGSGVTVACDLLGQGAHEVGELPVVRQRIGLDRQPIDLADPRARRWLEAFVWPEQVADLATLRAAVRTLLGQRDVRIVRGDATTDTAGLVLGLPRDEPVVVFTASLFTYLSPEQRRAFVEQLRAAGSRRRVAWIFAEAPGPIATTGLECRGLAGPLARVGTAYAVGVRIGCGTQHDDRLLAVADPYLRWLAPARTDDDDFAWARAEGLC